MFNKNKNNAPRHVNVNLSSCNRLIIKSWFFNFDNEDTDCRNQKILPQLRQMTTFGVLWRSRIRFDPFDSSLQERKKSLSSLQNVASMSHWKMTSRASAEVRISSDRDKLSRWRSCHGELRSRDAPDVMEMCGDVHYRFGLRDGSWVPSINVCSGLRLISPRDWIHLPRDCSELHFSRSINIWVGVHLHS